MGEVVSSIRRVTDTMAEISAASNEQSAGVAQMGEAIMQMDQATQQNAALVEQSAAASSSLQQQADALVHVVAAFQVDKESASVPVRVAAVPAKAAPKVPRAPATPSFPAVDRRSENRSGNVTRLKSRPAEQEPVELDTPVATRRSDAAGGWASF